jgi:hypothetical protein
MLSAYRDILVLADGDAWMLVIAMALSGASSNAVGATVSVGVFGRSVTASVAENAVLTADQGNILVQARGHDFTLYITFALGASGNNAFAGTIPVVAARNLITASVGDNVKLTAGDSIGVIANLDTGLYTIAGGVAGSGSNAVGATISAAILENQVKTLGGKAAELFAKGLYNSADPSLAGIQLPNRAARRRGVLVSATADEMVIMISIAAAGSAAWRSPAS